MSKDAEQIGAVQPALSAEEWARRAVDIADRYGTLYGDRATWPGYDDTEYVEWADRRHALAALALHGEAFGFTWEDVRFLRRCAAVADPDECAGPFIPSEVPATYRDLADRIAALLPPE